MLTAHLVRLDRLKPFFESAAGKFWKDVDANTCLTSLDEFVESLQLATAKITRGRNPKFILGNGKKMALRSAAAYCLDLSEEFIVARGLRQMQKKSNDTKKQLRMLESVPAKDEDDEKENVVKVNSTRKRKRKKSSASLSAPSSTPTIKIKRSALRPIVKAVAEKMLFVSNVSRPVTVEDVARERDSLATTLVRRAQVAAKKAQRKKPFSFFAAETTPVGVKKIRGLEEDDNDADVLGALMDAVLFDS